MKFSTNILLAPFFLVIVAAAWMTFHFTHSELIYRVVWIPLLLLVPGFLITLSLKFRSSGMWEYLFHSIGLSIAFVYVLGFGASFVLPLFGFSRPLELIPLSFVYEGFLAILLLIAMYRNRNSVVVATELGKRLMKFGVYCLAIVTSLISVAGAFYLNNSGNNVVTLSWLFLVVGTIFLSTFFQNRFVVAMRPFIILVLSLSVLWMLSARSWNLIGWDIVEETVVAKVTLASGKWTLKDIRDAYNACLSITILPAVLSNITTLPVDFFYKFVYTFLFAHFPVLIYFWSKKIASKDLSFFAVIYIIAQPFFNQSMVGLARQEIAFFFFTLLLFTIFTDHLRTYTKNILVLFYIAALVTSHYSTTYVAIIIFSGVYSVIFSLGLLKMVPLDDKLGKFMFYKNWILSYQSKIKWWMVAWLIGFTYLWYFLFTNTAGNVQGVIAKSLSGMSNLFQNEQKSQEVRSALPGVSNATVTTQADLNIYEHSYDENVENLKPERVFEIFDTYPLKPLYEYVVPANKQLHGAEINAAFNKVKDGLKYILIIGALILFVKSLFRANQNQDLVLFSCVSAGLLMVMLFHPTLGLQYNISRIYLQLMVFLALALMAGLDTLLWLLKPRIKHVVFGFTILSLLLYLQGALVPFLGGIPVLQYYDKGTDYDKNYVFQGELNSAKWLLENRKVQNAVYGDDFSGLRIRKVAFFFPKTTLVPVVLENDASGYVFLTNTNKNAGKSFVNFGGKLLTFEYPNIYLKDNRNLIYSNSKSEIYR